MAPNHLRERGWDDVCLSYTNIDNSGKRDERAKLKAIGVTDETIWAKDGIKAIISGFAHSYIGACGPARDVVRISRGLHEFREQIALFRSVTSDASERYRKTLARGPALGVALVTLRCENTRTRSAEFWRLVARNEGGYHSGPWWAHEILTTRDRKALGNFAETSRLIASAWNNFWDGNKTGSKLIPRMSPGIRIAGTPYTTAAVHTELFELLR
jgi:hypothetical protein